MKIAILGAMKQEIKPLKDIFGKLKETRYAQNVFYECKYKGIDIVMAYSKIGKVNASIVATLLIEKFGAEKLIFTGVAGALSSELKVGNMGIANKLIQHDVDISAFGHPLGYIPQSGDYFECSEELVDLAKKSAKDLGLKTTEGIIATGDSFVASKEKKDFIKNTFNAIATEMEGASVAYACSVLGVPFVVLRSISDESDSEASLSFEEFLDLSAKNSAQLCMKMLDGINAQI